MSDKDEKRPIIPPRDPDDDRTSITISVPKVLLREIQNVAKAEGYSRSALVVHLLHHALGSYRKEKQPRPTTTHLQSLVDMTTGKEDDQ